MNAVNSTIDAEGFLRDIKALRREIRQDLGEADLAHLRRTEWRGRIATVLGLATAWIAPNPFSAAALGLGRSTRWLMMHHIGHRGYDRVPGVPERHTSKVFGRKHRRWLDWADWMTPEAWNHEHNVLHHSHTGELADPDLIERNVETVQSLPKWGRWAVLVGLAATWRASYYAPNTTEKWVEKQLGREGTKSEVRRELWLRSWIPYAFLQFVALPALFLPLGTTAATAVLINSILADVLTNLHTFLVVGPNHTGDDLHRFDTAPETDAEYYVRQVVSSTNYATGTEALDYGQLWLNYQIEHHLFPDIPMLQYRKIQPKVREICERHGVPYVQESVWKRFAKMSLVFVGSTEMPRGLPSNYPAPESVPAEA